MIPAWLWVLGALALVSSGYGVGWEQRTWKANSDQLKAVEAAVQKAKAAQDEVHQNAIAAVRAERKIEVRYETVTKWQTRWRDRPAARVVCLDPDGLRIANAYLAGGADPGSVADGAVPPPAAGPQDRPR